jgi:hypothetical protein
VSVVEDVEECQTGIFGYGGRSGGVYEVPCRPDIGVGNIERGV